MIRIVIQWIFLGPGKDEEEVYPIICSGETDMNRFGSPPNYENCFLYEGPPPHGLSLGTAGRFFLIFQSPIRRGGAPSGAAAIIVPDG